MSTLFDVVKAKSRISGYTTSLNAKITSAEQLADQVLGPPILKSELVCDQLNKRLAEVQEAWDKLSFLLDQVIQFYEDNPDESGAKSKTSGAQHYID